MPPGARHAVRSLAVFLAVIAAGVLLAEGAVRVRQWLRIGQFGTINDTLMLDPQTGMQVPVPNLVRGGIRINSLGFRGPEIEVPKPAGVIRLAFLGGSTTYCAEASSNEATWPHLVRQTLQDAFPVVRLDYVNAGVPGYGLAALLHRFKRRVQPLQPDVVVIYEATNDLALDTRRLAIDGGVAAIAPQRESWLALHSLLWLLIEKNLRIRRLQIEAEHETGKLAFEPRELSRGFEQRLRDMIHAAQAVADVVAVATFAPRLRCGQSLDEQRRAANVDLYSMPYMTLEGLIAGYEEYNRVIRSVTVDSGAVLIGGEERIPADDLHYNDSVHFRDAGNAAMAARVTEGLLAAPEFRSLMSRSRAD